MGLLDSLVEGQLFCKELDGRTVFYPLGKRKTGYIVESDVDVARIKAFAKAHLFAALAVNVLGYMSGFGFGEYLIHRVFERSAAFLPQMAVMVGALTVFMIVPALVRLRLYQRTVTTFTAGLREVPSAPALRWPGAGVAVLVASGAILIVLGLLALTRYRPGH